MAQSSLQTTPQPSKNISMVVIKPPNVVTKLPIIVEVLSSMDMVEKDKKKYFM